MLGTNLNYADLGFNGLLIGQGTAGRNRRESSNLMRVSMASSSTKALPEKIREGIPSSLRVSMASSSAKALPGRRHAPGLPGQALVSMASSSAKALPAESSGGCSEPLPRFNGLLIGQGTAGKRLGLKFDDLWRFNGLLIGQGTAGPMKTKVIIAITNVSMASSSAKALPEQDCCLLRRASSCFNGLLIGQGTAGGRAWWSRSLAVSRFQWPPHRPRHCRVQEITLA